MKSYVDILGDNSAKARKEKSREKSIETDYIGTALRRRVREEHQTDTTS